jgi:hypothetical protein
VGNRSVELWSILKEDVCTIAIHTRKGIFWEFRTWAGAPEVEAIVFGIMEEFEGVLQAVEV